MAYRHGLPHLDDALYLTDGGMETSLIFHDGFELPHFAAFTLLADEGGREALRRYYARYVEVAAARGVGVVLDTATWRANPDWGFRLGYSLDRLLAANREAVELLLRLRDARGEGPPLVVNGAVGPRGDGYAASAQMSVEEAERYHELQIGSLAAGGVDMVTALTMTYAEEAAGVARAAAAAGPPVVVSFTVETDGRLPSGQALAEAVEQVDAESGGAAVYFMVNCAHPSHFAHLLRDEPGPLERIRGVRANASAKSHAELDEADELDEGDPHSLALELAALRRRVRSLAVLGGCCGTDHRHIAALADAAAG